MHPHPALSRDLSPRYYTFWSINGALNQAKLRAQLDAFKAAGLHGVVFHPRFYPGIPPYLSTVYLAEVSACILYAKAIGLRFWLYDENGWPSGTGDGRVLAHYPDSGAMRLDLTPQATPESLGSFCVNHSNQLVAADTAGATTWYLTPRKINYVDSLDPRVLGHFLELIHEPYRTGLDPEAWDYVEALFFDEPESGMIKDPFPEQAGIPWSRVMPDKLRKKFGDDYVEIIPLLFAQSEGSEDARVKFWELVTDTLIDGFFKPYHAWCRQHDKQFIGHVKGEEHPLFQLPMVGSCHRVFRHLTMPGIDALERFSSLDFFPRQAASAARQFAEGRSMVECFGGAGWGASPEDLERYLLWLGRNGITDFVFHLSQYRLDTPALTDWPPSEPLHLSWRDAFPAVLDRVSRELTTTPSAKSDTLVVAPYRGLMAQYEPWELMQTNMHNASTLPDTPATRINTAFLATLEKLKADGIAYDLTDERTLEEDGEQLPNGRVRLGQAEYANLVIDPAAQLHGKWVDVAGVADPGSYRPGLVAGVALSAVASAKADDPGPASARPATTIPLNWTIPALPENAWLIEPQRTATREYTAHFETAFAESEPSPLTLHFADDLISANFQGRPLPFHHTDEGAVAALPALGSSRHTLVFKTQRDFPAKPFIWLKGAFTLRSRTPYLSGPNGTLRTAGPFVATNDCVNPTAELVAAGFPFLFKPLVAECAVAFDEPVASLSFPETIADTIHLSIDEHSIGWVWGPDWQITLPQSLAAGSHRIRFELIPSSYNHYGPHHYYNGDWPVVSPGQIVGEKNFADAPDAPDHTHVAAWHCKPLRLPTQLTAQS